MVKLVGNSRCREMLGNLSGGLSRCSEFSEIPIFQKSSFIKVHKMYGNPLDQWVRTQIRFGIGPEFDLVPDRYA